MREGGFHGAALHASTAESPESSGERAEWNISDGSYAHKSAKKKKKEKELFQTQVDCIHASLGKCLCVSVISD